MSDATIFLAGVGLTAMAAALVVGYLRPHLYGILVDLCGTTEDRKSRRLNSSHSAKSRMPSSA